MLPTCPKCGFQQDRGEECLSCGIIFEKFRQPAYQQHRVESESRPFAVLRDAFRLLRWCSLVLCLVVLALIFNPAESPAVATDPDAAQRVQVKLDRLQKNVSRGRSHVLSLDESEINSFLGRTFELGGEDTSSSGELPMHDRRLNTAEVEAVRSSIRDFKVSLQEDQVSVYMAFDYHGKDMSLSLKGRLGVAGHYLVLDPTSGSLGSLPLPGSVLKQAVDRLFESPENREKFRLPDRIRHISVEGGHLQVVYEQAT